MTQWDHSGEFRGLQAWSNALGPVIVLTAEHGVHSCGLIVGLSQYLAKYCAYISRKEYIKEYLFFTVYLTLLFWCPLKFTEKQIHLTQITLCSNAFILKQLF